MTTTPPGRGAEKKVNGSGSIWPRVLAGLIIFAAGVAVGYVGLPLQNAKAIAAIQQELKSNAETVRVLRSRQDQDMVAIREELREINRTLNQMRK